MAEIKKQPSKTPKFKDPKKYVGTSSVQYHISNAVKFKIVKKWAKQHADISFNDFSSLLDSLNNGDSHEEKSLVGTLLGLFPKYRSLVTLTVLEKWLSNVAGWAEVDNLCQNNFKYQDLFLDWATWEKAICRFSESKNVHIRRASLVLLVGPVNYSADERLSKLAFANIEKLKSEKDILITKAISWLLRSLIKHHKKEVAKYLEKNLHSLPKIAVREVSNKLKYGIKKKLG